MIEVNKQTRININVYDDDVTIFEKFIEKACEKEIGFKKSIAITDEERELFLRIKEVVGAKK